MVADSCGKAKRSRTRQGRDGERVKAQGTGTAEADRNQIPEQSSGRS